MIAGLDISNWQSEVSPERARCWANAGIGHVVVRASLEDMPRVNLARRQMTALRDAGIDISAYLWLYPSWDPAKTVADAMREYGPLEIPRWWVDVEEVANPAPPAVQIPNLRTTLAELEKAGRTVGIYTAAWYWNDPAYIGGTHEFAHHDLWLAYYDNNPDINRWVGFGGWTPGAANVIGKQYTGTGSLCGLSPLDRNTFLDSVIVRPEPDPQPDPRDGQIAQLTASKIGLRDAYTASVGSLDALAGVGRTITAQAEDAARSARDAIQKWGA